MKKLLFTTSLLLCAFGLRARTQVQLPVFACDDAIAEQPVLVGMTDTAAYFPLLEGRRVAVLANHTAVAGFGGGQAAGEPPGADCCGAGRMPGASADGTVHLVDLLYGRGFDVTAIFSPEHGFRGTADAGEHVASSVDTRTGIPIRSLYDGNTKRPSDEAMRSFDVLLVDMQDVGLRFYTYYISMLRMMDACADYGCRVVVLDRPNPNGSHVDGPLLDMKYKSGVGALPVPVLHGLTMGEIARMALGEGWAKPCELVVVRCRNYTHDTPYELPVAPSPNLPRQRAVYLYPSVCLFEGTVVSLGRGTDKPFECYGHPDMKGYAFAFTPRPTAGAKHPPLEGKLCRGVDLSGMPLDEAREQGLTLKYVMEAYRNLGLGDKFFTPMFEKLIGAGYVREMIVAGASEAEIRARWAEDVRRFRALRERYLLYE
ncbi:exo-beta-N-acetylmuramidase NamZ domain-containing protein [Alistipes sp.]|uniref:exo-beta-N-acetylmuramidase NamZ family protein n=1 Tax=Alistipes sp. TaxID=1872444 RepID=UPI003AF5204B